MHPAPAAPSYQFGDSQQQSIVDLAGIFESAIARPALPSIIPPHPAFRTVIPPPPQVPITPEYPKVTVPLESPRVNIPPTAPRVKIPSASSHPSPPTVSLPVHLHVIDPDYNGDNIDAVTFYRYRLRLHRQQRPFPHRSRITLQPTPAPWTSHPVFLPALAPIMREPLGTSLLLSTAAQTTPTP